MREPMFKVGDRITVREDLKEGSIDFHGDTRYGTQGESVVNDMMKYRGKSAVITEVSSNGKYYLDIDKEFWSWTHHMFEEGKEESNKDAIRFEIGDKVTIRSDLTDDMVFIEEERDGYIKHDTQNVNSKMINLGGQIATITGINDRGEYNIDLDGGFWDWTHHMFKEGDRLDVLRQLKEERTKQSTEKPNETTRWESVYIKPSRVEELDKLVDIIVDRLKTMVDEIDIRLDRMIVDMAFAKGIKELSDDEKETLISNAIMRINDTLDIRIYKSSSKILLNFM